MRCDEVLDRLPLFIYDELSADEAPACRLHLEACPACRAELASLRHAYDALDRAPQRQSQVDLAAVCLRIAARERRGRVRRRLAISIAAVAATLLAIASLRLVNVAMEPGRIVVAWSANPGQRLPARLATEPDSSSADRIARDERSSAPTLASPEAVPMVLAARHDFDPTLPELAFEASFLTGLAARRGISPGQARALRYAQPARPHSAAKLPATSYHDLRLELLAPHGRASTAREAPGA